MNTASYKGYHNRPSRWADLPWAKSMAEIWNMVPVLNTQEVFIQEAPGHVLAEDVFADFDIPPLHTAACDGYALRVEDVCGASAGKPKTLLVEDVFTAGTFSDRALKAGHAVMVMSGAVLPRGANCIIPYEDVERRSDGIREFIILRREGQLGLNIHPAGAEARRGTRLLRTGDMLGPVEIGLLASIGRKVVRAVRKPVVSILPTGDELLTIEEPGGGGKKYTSTAYSLSALVHEWGGIPRLGSVVPDNLPSLEESLFRNIDADLVVTTGGTSFGVRDLVNKTWLSRQQLLVKCGERTTLRVLELKDKRYLLHLALPGQPLNSLLLFELYGRLILAKMSGMGAIPHRFVQAKFVSSRKIFKKCILVRLNERAGSYEAEVIEVQNTSSLLPLTVMDGWIPFDLRISAISSEEVPVLIPSWVKKPLGYSLNYTEEDGRQE